MTTVLVSLPAISIICMVSVTGAIFSAGVPSGHAAYAAEPLNCLLPTFEMSTSHRCSEEGLAGYTMAASLAANVPQGSGDGKQPSVSQACRNTGGEACPLILDFCSLPPTLLLPDTQCWGLRWFCYPVLARTYRFRSLT